jgi:hypothetical protein
MQAPSAYMVDQGFIPQWHMNFVLSGSSQTNSASKRPVISMLLNVLTTMNTPFNCPLLHSCKNSSRHVDLGSRSSATPLSACHDLCALYINLRYSMIQDKRKTGRESSPSMRGTHCSISPRRRTFGFPISGTNWSLLGVCYERSEGGEDFQSVVVEQVSVSRVGFLIEADQISKLDETWPLTHRD